MECWLYDKCNHVNCNKQFCLRKYKLNYLYTEALLSESQKKHAVLRVDADGTDLEEFKRLANIEKNIDVFVAEKQNLFIHSSQCGNGKSSWAVRMLTSYLDKIWPETALTCRVLFISVPTFLLASKDKISSKNEYFDHIKENYLNADIIVWDDIGNKEGTEYEINQILSMIDARLMLEKTNIFTSNLNYNQMISALGERLASRICNKSIDIELHGADKRKLQTEAQRKW